MCSSAFLRIITVLLAPLTLAACASSQVTDLIPSNIRVAVAAEDASKKQVPGETAISVAELLERTKTATGTANDAQADTITTTDAKSCDGAARTYAPGSCDQLAANEAIKDPGASVPPSSAEELFARFMNVKKETSTPLDEDLRRKLMPDAFAAEKTTSFAATQETARDRLRRALERRKKASANANSPIAPKNNSDQLVVGETPDSTTITFAPLSHEVPVGISEKLRVLFGGRTDAAKQKITMTAGPGSDASALEMLSLAEKRMKALSTLLTPHIPGPFVRNFDPKQAHDTVRINLPVLL